MIPAHPGSSPAPERPPTGGESSAADKARGAPFWVFALLAGLVVGAAAFAPIRALFVAVLTTPFQLAGWVLPGASVSEDAKLAGALLGWVGWAIAGAWSLPLLHLALARLPGVAGLLDPLTVPWRGLATLSSPLGVLVSLLMGGALAFFIAGLQISGGHPVLILGCLGAALSLLIASQLGATPGARGRAGALVSSLILVAPLVAAAWGVAAGRLLAPAIALGGGASLLLAAPGLFVGADRPLAAFSGWIADAIDDGAALLADTVRWAALAMVAVVVTIVIQRYVFGVAFTKLAELVIYLHAALFMLIAAPALRTDDHVRVDVFYGQLSDRGRAFVNLLGVYLLLAPTCVMILLTSSGYVEAAWRVSERSAESDGLPLVFVLKTLIPAFAILVLAQGGSVAARAALILGEGRGVRASLRRSDPS